MTTITIDVTQFTEALTAATNRTLKWVWLQPTAAPSDELIPPTYVPTPPAVMPSFALIASTSYRFDYTAVRYARFCYLLERNGSYESGELSVIHNLVATTAPSSENTPPPVPAPFVPPTISTYQTVSIGSVGSLGVIFSFIHDASTSGATAQFGLAYQITNASPSVYPKLNLSYVTALPPEDI